MTKKRPIFRIFGQRKGFRWQDSNIRPKSGMRIVSREMYEASDIVYHFTSLENCKKILKSGCLRFGHLYSSNDIIETHPGIFFEHIEGDSADYDSGAVLDVLHKYHICCLAQSPQSGVPVFANHAMWGHYGDNGKGACLVFDKAILCMQARQMGALVGEICYENNYSGQITVDPRNIEGSIEDQKGRIFFRKRKEWELENELRLL